MKIVFMGTPAFAVDSLEACIREHEVVAVFTQPDKPKGRSKKLVQPEVKVCALAHDIPVYQPTRLKKSEESIELLKSLKPDVIVVVAFGQILHQEVLDIPKYGCVNVHGSLLPKYRGAAPIQWAVANGDAQTGITTMLLDAGIDTGDMLLKEAVAIPKDATAYDMEVVLAEVGANLLLKTLDGIEAGRLVPEPQSDEDSTYAVILDKTLSNIDWTMPATLIESRIRGFNPWPIAYSYYKGETLKIFKAEVIASETVLGQVGEIVDVDKKSFTVQTGEGLLKILEIQLGSQKRMLTQAFLLGRTIEKGIVFSREKEENLCMA